MRGREERRKFSLRLVQGVSWEEEIIGTRIIHRRNLHCSRVMWLRFLQTPPRGWVPRESPLGVLL